VVCRGHDEERLISSQTFNAWTKTKFMSVYMASGIIFGVRGLKLLSKYKDKQRLLNRQETQWPMGCSDIVVYKHFHASPGRLSNVSMSASLQQNIFEGTGGACCSWSPRAVNLVGEVGWE
jgi:hypothetical protein